MEAYLNALLEKLLCDVRRSVEMGTPSSQRLGYLLVSCYIKSLGNKNCDIKIAKNGYLFGPSLSLVGRQERNVILSRWDKETSEEM